MNRIARWDGSSWHSLASGMNSAVDALEIHASSLIAGGLFTSAGAVPANGVARWSGSAWSALGGGVNGRVFALASHPGSLVVGGSFSTAGGNPAQNIARWNGSQWISMSSSTNGIVQALCSVDSLLYAGGRFTVLNGQSMPFVAQWNGTSWASPGAGVNGPVLSIARYDTLIAVGGEFTSAAGSPTGKLAFWNGRGWLASGSGTDTTVLAMAESDSGLYVAGDFSIAGRRPASRLSRYRQPYIVPFEAGWNMVSLPHAASRTQAAFYFPEAVGNLWSFESNQYQAAVDLRNGPGYWAYLVSPTSVPFAGTAIQSVQVQVPDGGRWYMIGSISRAIPVGNVSTNPAGAILSGSVYEYAGGQYRAPAEIQPGRGYWVYLLFPCTIRLQ